MSQNLSKSVERSVLTLESLCLFQSSYYSRLFSTFSRDLIHKCWFTWREERLKEPVWIVMGKMPFSVFPQSVKNAVFHSFREIFLNFIRYFYSTDKNVCYVKTTKLFIFSFHIVCKRFKIPPLMERSTLNMIFHFVSTATYSFALL